MTDRLTPYAAQLTEWAASIDLPPDQITGRQRKYAAARRALMLRCWREFGARLTYADVGNMFGRMTGEAARDNIKRARCERHQENDHASE